MVNDYANFVMVWQDYKSVSVQAGGARGSQAAGLPPIGRPGMVHPHPNYGLSPAEGFHSAGGRLAYGHSHGGLTQLMQMNRVPGGDLGPPLFMPGQILTSIRPNLLNPLTTLRNGIDLREGGVATWTWFQ